MIRRIRRLFQKSRAENELDRELRFHLEQQIADYVAAGISPEDARRRARLHFGGVDRVKEEVRNTRWETHIDNLARDVRYALRTLRKGPRFALTTILTIALGVGATTMVFSVIYNGLLRPFPYKDANRLSTFYVHDIQDANLQAAGRGDRGGLTSAELLAVKEQARSFENIIGLMNDELSCACGQIALQLHAAFVTPDTFEFLGVAPLLGRSIVPQDATPSAPPVFAMNYRVWQKYFNADPKIVGSAFAIGGVPRTLVAVMPSRFQMDAEGSDVWIPRNPDPAEDSVSSNAAEPMRTWWPLARLKSGTAGATAESDLNVIAQRLAKTYPALYPAQFSIVLRPLVDVVIGDFRSMVDALAAAVAILLLITCSNVANLLLARGTTREKEIAIRALIGASRSRLVSQLLLESLVLAVAGGALGCLFAVWGLRGFLAVLPSGTLPAEAVITLNPVVLLFALVATIVTAILCGLVSALYGLRGELQARLAGSGKSSGADGRGSEVRAALVIVEVALSIVLLVGAGLMTRTLLALTHVDLGFSPSHILATELALPDGNYRSAPERKFLFGQVLRRVSASPGVVAAALTASMPPYGGPGSDVEFVGSNQAERASVLIDPCSEGLFQTLGIRLLRGRLFSNRDVESADRVVVVSQALARHFFRTSDPLGQKIKFKVLDLIPDAPHDAYFEIVGVVSDIRNRGLRDPAEPQAYLPYTLFGTPGGNILVRTLIDPLSVAKQVHNEILSVDSNIALTDTSSLETYLHRYDYATPEFGIVTIGAFAGIGLLLAAIGIFGVMAYMVSVRVHEIGIRMALGAGRLNILQMIFIKGVGLVAAGTASGLCASYVLTRFISSQVWGVSLTDPWTYACVLALILVVGFAACFLPAHRAASVDPLIALRYE